jgi:shikimate dehydrogenase
MQNAALAQLGLEDWSYEAIDVAPDAFEEKVRDMAAGEFIGANVTVPHKGAALAVADDLSEVAREVGAANTLEFTEGRIRASNTDAEGFSRAVVWALVRAGAAVDVWNRTPVRSQNLCEDLGGSAVADPDQASYDLVANTTAVGLHGEDAFAELPLEAAAFRPGQLVVDLVYADEETALLTGARAQGARVVGGLDVLVAQGAASLKIWTGQDPPVEVMRRAAGSPAAGPR